MDYINGRLDCVASANDLEREIRELQNNKQDKLISGINISKINGEDLLNNVDLKVGVLTSDLVSEVAIGKINVGDSFAAGTPIETILRKLLTTSND